MRTQIVGDDMDLTTCRLALYDLRKEIDKLGAGVACAGFRQDLSGLSVQSAVERKGSMAVVLETMPFSAAGRKWQNRIQAIQRLDGALLVHAEDRGNALALVGGRRLLTADAFGKKARRRALVKPSVMG